MSAGFDPYHRWLSIPSSEQPPTHYRILGLPPFERDPQVIENAALRQIAHVRSFLETPMRPYAVNLIHELSVARQCLIKSESKAAYDAWLRQLSPASATVTTPQRPHFVPSSAPVTALQASVRRRSGTTAKQPPLGPASQLTAPVSNDWIDAAPIGEGTENLWGAEPKNTSPEFDFEPRLNITRRRKKSPVAVCFSLLMWIIGTAAGILAGYAILCIMDSKFDYLHLFNTQQPDKTNVPTIVVPPINPPAPHSKEPTIPPPHKAEQPFIPAPNPAPGKPNLPLAPPVPPQAAANPLDKFPTHVSLPPMAIVDPPLALASLPIGIEPASIDLSLIDGGHHEKGNLDLIESPSAPPFKQWTVRWTPAVTDMANVNEIDPKDIGTVSLSVDGLTYGWTADVPKQLVSALRNSLLRIAAGEDEHFIALRDPIESRPLTIDLKTPHVRATCKCDDPPQPSDIRVDITSLDDFPPYRVDGAGLTGLKLGDKITLQYTEVDQAATQISIIRTGALVSIQAESRYQLPSGDEEGMSVTLGVRKVKQLNLRLDDAHRANDELQKLRTHLNNTLPAKLRAAQNMSTGAYLPNGAYVESPQLAMEKQNRIAEINNEAANTRQQIEKDAELAAQIPEIEADIAEINKVSEFAERIHGKAAISFRFYRVVGDHQVELMVSN